MLDPANPYDFTALHAEHEERLLGYLHRLTRDPSLAEELAQETFLRASRSLEGFRGRSKLKTWLYRIATNAYLDHCRAQASRTPDPEKPLPQPPAPSLPDRLFEDSEMGRCIRGFVDQLAPDHRTAIILHDLQGLTNPEFAEVLDCSLDAVKIRVHRARRTLRALLVENCEFEYGDGDVLQCDRKPAAE